MSKKQSRIEPIIHTESSPTNKARPTLTRSRNDKQKRERLNALKCICLDTKIRDIGTSTCQYIDVWKRSRSKLSSILLLLKGKIHEKPLELITDPDQAGSLNTLRKYMNRKNSGKIYSVFFQYYPYFVLNPSGKAKNL